MRWVLALLVGMASTSARAAEVPLSSAELPFDGTTLGQNHVQVRPFEMSAWGVTDRVDLKVAPLGLVVGPNLGVEVGLVRTEHLWLSVDARVTDMQWREWVGTYPRASARLTWGHRRQRWTLAAGAGWFDSIGPEDTLASGKVVNPAHTWSGLSTPVELTYENIKNEQTIWALFATTDIAGHINGVRPFTEVGFESDHALDPHFRLCFGAMIHVDSHSLVLGEWASFLKWAPLPRFGLWWTW